MYFYIMYIRGNKVKTIYTIVRYSNTKGVRSKYFDKLKVFIVVFFFGSVAFSFHTEHIMYVCLYLA